MSIFSSFFFLFFLHAVSQAKPVSGIADNGGPAHRYTAHHTHTHTHTRTHTHTQVSQVYLGFPAEAGEPPRQLKGFAKTALSAPSTPSTPSTISTTYTPSASDPSTRQQKERSFFSGGHVS